MKTLILSIFGILLMNLAFAQIGPRTQFQNFDGEDSTIFCPVTDPYLVCIRLDPDTGNIWFAGNQPNVKKTKGNFVTDSSLYYRSNDTSSFIIDLIDALPSYFESLMQLSWSHYMDLGKGDYGKVEISKDTGKTWINCFESAFKVNLQAPDHFDLLDTLANGDIVFTGTDFGFMHRIDLIYEFDPLSTQDKVQVRFTFVTDATSSPNIGWVIDSLEVYIYYPGDVQKLERNGLIKTYPNPVTHMLNIETTPGNSTENIGQLFLYNSLGQKIAEWSGLPSKFSIDTQPYPNGVYFLKSANTTGFGTTTVVIQHE